MIEYITEDKYESVENVKSLMLTEAQKEFDNRFARRYPKLGEMLDSSDAKEQWKAATTIKRLVNQEMFMENMKKAYGEASIVSKLGDLAPRIIDILRIALPNSIDHIIADIQPLDRLTGQIVVVKPQFTHTAAGVTAGTEVFANQTDGSYSSTSYVDSVGVGNGSTTSFSKTLSVKVTKPFSFKILTNNTVVAQDNGVGGFTGTGINTGASSINYTTGALVIAFTSAPASGAVITTTYSADIELAEDNYLRELDLGLTVIPVTAKEHPLRLRWSEQARLVAMSTVGLDIDDTITNMAGIFMKIERDRNAINMIRTAAGSYNSLLAFDATAGPSAQTTRQYFQDFLIRISRSGNIIFSSAGRGGVSFLIAGTGASTLIESLSTFVRETNIVPIGAHVIGYLDGVIPVIKDPALPAGEWIAGFTGSLVGDAGVVIADWIPIYFTPTLVTSDLKGSKALLSMYDTVTVNSRYYVRGLVANI